jgi:hypothetical protein
MRLMGLFATFVLIVGAAPLAAQAAESTASSSKKAPPGLRARADDLENLRLTPKLPDAKRLELLNRARADLKLPPLQQPPVSTTRISASTPISPAGAMIRHAIPRGYVARADSEKDGYFSFGPATANGGGDMIKLHFPAEPGKLYLLDCKVRVEGAQPIMFSSEVGAPVTESALPVDDHVIVVARATGSTLVRVLQSKASNWWWSACDIAPAG